jgi:hypothetical protein
MIKFAVAASALMALSAPVAASTTTTNDNVRQAETVRQAVCVKVTIRNPDGSGSSTEKCTISSSGAS